MLVINDRIRIPLRELHFSFARSSGPGGQNVNKLNTKVVLHWQVLRSRSLPEDVRQRFLARYGRRVNELGEVVIRSQRFRERARNVADCTEKLRAMLTDVAVAPRRRRRTRPTQSSVERRLRQKRRRSLTKRQRGGARRGEEP